MTPESGSSKVAIANSLLIQEKSLCKQPEFFRCFKLEEWIFRHRCIPPEPSSAVSIIQFYIQIFPL
jgi:hypothetical protein